MTAGQTVWRDFDRATLEREYSPSSCVDNFDELIAAYVSRSKESEARAAVRKDLAYGDHADETLDFFPASNRHAPLHVFIHGGYWQELSKNESTFAGADFVAEGVAFAAVNYSLAPHAGIGMMIEQCQRSLTWLYDNAEALGFDRERIFVSGSSAGAHLAAMLLTTDWTGYDVPADVIKGATLMSGIYDLQPLCHTYVNEPLQMDEGKARELSPLFMSLTDMPPAIICWGENETDEFKRQSSEFAAAWSDAGSQATVFEVAGRNHFDIVHELSDRSSPLGRQVLAQALRR